LPTRHAIVEIVDADNVQVDVAPGSMNEMIATNCGEITIAADNRYFEFWIVNGDAQRKR
jgi:hypothetical protein